MVIYGSAYLRISCFWLVYESYPLHSRSDPCKREREVKKKIIKLIYAGIITDRCRDSDCVCVFCDIVTENSVDQKQWLRCIEF